MDWIVILWIDLNPSIYPNTFNQVKPYIPGQKCCILYLTEVVVSRHRDVWRLAVQNLGLVLVSLLQRLVLVSVSDHCVSNSGRDCRNVGKVHRCCKYVMIFGKK